MTHIHLPVDRRYLMIAQDGHHSVLGRQTEPSDETLANATAGLDFLGMAGWCVLSEGRHGTPGDRLALLPIRRLTTLDGSWDQAAAAFDALRATAHGAQSMIV